MKRKTLAVTLLALLALAFGITTAGDEQAWFDLENCTFCKHLGAEKGLMDHIEWETHMVANGTLTVALIDPAYKEAFQRAGKNMQDAAAKMGMGGEPPRLCGFCTSYGKLMMAGAVVEEIESAAAHISLVTSSDPGLVKMIQEHGQRTIDEYAKWSAGKDDHGHGH